MNTANLARHQSAMTSYLRDPDNIAAPENLDTRRLNVYRDLVFNNIESQLASGFPVIQSILKGENWLALVREFVRDYRAETPYFTQLSAEFVNFLAARCERQGEQEEAVEGLALPDFILELAHYERVELDVYMSDDDAPRLTLGSNDLLRSPLTLSSTSRILAYAYPVHMLGPDKQIEAAPETPTMLLLFQDDEGEVRFFELQALAFHLVNKLASNTCSTTQSLLEQLASEAGLTLTETFYQQALQLLEQLNSLKVLRAV